MATLYFNGTVDTNWNTLGNWWTSDEFATQASALPTSSDSAVLSATCDTNSGSEPTVVNFTLNDPSSNSYYIAIAFTVTGNATFTASSYTGNPAGGTVTGTTTFSSASPVSFTMNNNTGNWTVDTTNWVFTTAGQNWTFNNTSYNSGTVTGNATFNGESYNNVGGTISGNATFNNGAYLFGGSSVDGNATFYDIAKILTGGTVSGNATFYNNSYNMGTAASATFNDTSYNDGGDVTGTATFSLSSASRQIVDGYNGTYGSVAFDYEKGINGSSILGIV